jgi:hypothetical protein
VSPATARTGLLSGPGSNTLHTLHTLISIIVLGGVRVREGRLVKRRSPLTCQHRFISERTIAIAVTLTVATTAVAASVVCPSIVTALVARVAPRGCPHH